MEIEVFSPEKATRELESFGFTKDTWDYLQKEASAGRYSFHHLLALIEIAQGTEARKLADVYKNIRFPKK